MQRAYRCFHHAVGHGDFQSVGADFFDLRRPLINDRNVQARLGEIRGYAAADGAATQQVQPEVKIKATVPSHGLVMKKDKEILDLQIALADAVLQNDYD